MYNGKRPLEYECKSFRERVAESKAQLRFNEAIVGPLEDICERAGKAIEALNLVRLPRVWYTTEYSARKNTWALENTPPTTIVPGQNCHTYADLIGHDDNDLATVVVEGKATCVISSSPSWAAWHRWPDTFITQFYAAMLAVRQEFGSPAMTDYSQVKTRYAYEQLSFRYKTKKPVVILETDLAVAAKRWDRTYTKSTTKFFLDFVLEIPNPPEGYSGSMFGCRVEKEEVTETVTRVKKTMVCD